MELLIVVEYKMEGHLLVFKMVIVGDTLEFQYIANATTVTINSSNTYNTGVGQIAHGWIQRID